MDMVVLAIPFRIQGILDQVVVDYDFVDQIVVYQCFKGSVDGGPIVLAVYLR